MISPSVVATKPKVLAPFCVQNRAPSLIGFKDEQNGRPVSATLAGYLLERGRRYRLIVEYPEGAGECTLKWDGLPHALIMDGQPKDNGRQKDFGFLVAGVYSSWRALISEAATLELQSDFVDCREMHKLRLPIILTPASYSWLIVLVAPAILAVPPHLLTEEPSKVFTLAKLGMYIGFVAVVLTGTFIWGLLLRWRTACKLVADSAQF